MILVVGLSRCGSSAMMGMLKAAGVPIWADPEPPLRYDNMGIWQADPRDWLHTLGDRAVKCLAPPAFRLPRDVDQRRMILMTRRLPDQLASEVTALKTLYDWPIDRAERKRLTAIYRDGTAKLLRLFGGALHVRFHEFMADPLATARRVAGRLGLAADPEIMASTVWRRPVVHTGIMLDPWGN